MFYYFLWSTFFYLGLVLQPTQGERVVRQNIGVIYEQLPGNIISGHDVHEIILSIPYSIPETPRPKPPIWDVIRSLQTPTLGPMDSADAKLLQQASDLDQLIINIDTNIILTMRNIRHFLSNPLSDRPKRAILAFLGELFKSIFGLATTKDINAVINTIMYLDKKMVLLADVNIRMAEGLQSVAQQHQDFLDTYVKDEDVVKQALLNITDSIDCWSDDFSTTLTSMQSEQDRHAAQSAIISAQTVVLLTRLAYQQGLAKIENALRLLSTGILAPDMITPPELALKLELLNAHLRIANPGAEVSIINTAYYYSQPVSLYTYTTTHLYIHINVIISSSASAYSLYQIITIDVPIDTENTNGTGSTALMTKNKNFLAVNAEERLYLELSSADLLTCQGDIMRVCARTIPRVYENDPTCHVAAFTNNLAQIARLCTFQIQPFKTIQTTAIAIGKDKYLVSTNEDEYAIHCHHRAMKKEKATAYAVIGIPCKCHLTFGGLYLPNTEIPCNESRSTHYIMHTVNMPILTALTDSVVDITPSSLHKDPIIIPHLHTEAILKTLGPTTELSEDMTVDLVPFTKLILQDAKKAAIEINTPLQTTTATEGMASLFNHAAWKYIVTLVITLNAIVTVIVVFKTLGRQAIFAALPTASALPLNVTWKHLIPSSKTQTVHIDQYVDAENIITIMIIALVAYLLFKIGKYLKKKITQHFGLTNSSKKTNPTITLKIYNGHTNHTIPLVSVPYEMDAITRGITPPVPIIRTLLCPHPRIVMAWSGPITLNIDDRPRAFCLPNQILLPLAARFTVIPALRDPTTTTAIILKTNDITYSLPTTNILQLTDNDIDEGDNYQPLVVLPKDMTTLEILTALTQNKSPVGNEN